MQALKHFYYDLGDKIWGEYGFADGFSETKNWYAKTHLAIDEGPIVVMIENYRTGLLWKSPNRRQRYGKRLPTTSNCGGPKIFTPPTRRNG